MDWFRFYNEVVDDPKAQRLEPSLFKSWVNVLCLASKNGGKLPSNADLAFSMRMSEESVAAVLSALEAVELLDRTENGLVPHNWEVRQYKSDSSTGRVKQHRERKKQSSDSVTRNVTETLDETHQSRAETEQSRAEQSAPPAKEIVSQTQRLERLLGLDETDYVKHVRNVETVVKLREDGCDFERHILKAAESVKSGSARAISYIRPKALELLEAERKVKSMPTPFENTDARGWSDRLEHFNKTSRWLAKWGPRPDEPGCRAPSHLTKRDAA